MRQNARQSDHNVDLLNFWHFCRHWCQGSLIKLLITCSLLSYNSYIRTWITYDNSSCLVLFCSSGELSGASPTRSCSGDQWPWSRHQAVVTNCRTTNRFGWSEKCEFPEHSKPFLLCEVNRRMLSENITEEEDIDGNNYDALCGLW